jgi:hypothetical protein
MNLDLLPASLNRAKSDKVTDRAKVFAKELYGAKLLSEEGWGFRNLEQVGAGICPIRAICVGLIVWRGGVLPMGQEIA